MRVALGGNQRHFVANVGPIGASAVRIKYIQSIHTFIHGYIYIHTTADIPISTSFKLAPPQERIDIKPREYLRAH